MSRFMIYVKVWRWPLSCYGEGSCEVLRPIVVQACSCLAMTCHQNENVKAAIILSTRGAVQMTTAGFSNLVRVVFAPYGLCGPE